MTGNEFPIRFLYGTAPGRVLLKLVRKTRADRLIVRILRSRQSRPFALWYARKNCPSMSREERRSYRSFRDFFARSKAWPGTDITPGHLISPCDGWMSAYPVNEGGSFAIKGSRYRVGDLLEDMQLAKKYIGGLCLVFRLTAADCHHYCYIDDGYQGSNHFIPGQLHSVQPIACEAYPVYTLNRRSWCLMATERFGPVVQTEIGALIVGGIVNHRENTRIICGSEKGHFELAGSSIVLLFEQGRVRLRQALADQMGNSQEVRVERGMWIADRCGEAGAG